MWLRIGLSLLTNETSVLSLWQMVSVRIQGGLLMGAGSNNGGSSLAFNDTDYVWHQSRLRLRAKRRTILDRGGRSRISGVSYYPSSSYHLTLFLLLSALMKSAVFFCQTGLNEVSYLVSVRYVVKNWRPAFKLVSSQSGLSYSDNPSLVNSNWLNGTLLRGWLWVTKWIASFVEGTGLCWVVGHGQRRELFWLAHKPKGPACKHSLVVFSVFLSCLEAPNHILNCLPGVLCPGDLSRGCSCLSPSDHWERLQRPLWLEGLVFQLFNEYWIMQGS